MPGEMAPLGAVLLPQKMIRIGGIHPHCDGCIGHSFSFVNASEGPENRKPPDIHQGGFSELFETFVPHIEPETFPAQVTVAFARLTARVVHVSS